MTENKIIYYDHEEKEYKIRHGADKERVKQMKKDAEDLLEKYPNMMVRNWCKLMSLLIQAEKILKVSEEK